MTSRRQFLGAAAALASISTASETALAADGAGEDTDGSQTDLQSEQDGIWVNFSTDRLMEDSSLTVRSTQNDPVYDLEVVLTTRYNRLHISFTNDAGQEILDTIEDVQGDGYRSRKITSSGVRAHIGDGTSAEQDPRISVLADDYDEGGAVEINVLAHWGCHTLNLDVEQDKTFRRQLQEALDG